jgi:REP element-mobilizing transposase RayT
LTRPLPFVRASSWYHVSNRGIAGASLFPTPGDRDGFIRSLGDIAHDFSVELHAFCAMNNHYHLLARADEADLRRALAALDFECSVTTEGALFRRMVFGRHLLQVTRYIHRNPVGAGLVTRPEDWRWSSYPGYLDPALAPAWLVCSAVLGCLGTVGGRQRYRRYVEG